MKRMIARVLSAVMILSLCACGNGVSEEARAVQHKIDKALESTPTYGELEEIRESYNDLLEEERATVKDYDKIEPLFELNATEVSAVYAVQQLKDRLKNPSSLKLLSVAISKPYENTSVPIKIDYTAENNIGGTVEDTYYCVVSLATYDKDNDTWSCGLESLFQSRYRLELVNSLLGSKSSIEGSQEYAKKEYNRGKPANLDAEKIISNQALTIKEVEN